VSGAVITLLTDFGSDDSYVAEVKGVLLAGAPDSMLVDITHAVPQGDVLGAQYLLMRTWWRFPPGTVHLAVVDPGVGSGRRAIVVRHRRHAFVAPDNGLLTPVLDDTEVVALSIPASAAPTFHGRDVFAPAAAALASGRRLADLGSPVRDPVRCAPPEPHQDGAAMVGEVVWVDQFGNLVTNLPATGASSGSVIIGEQTIGPLARTFSDVAPGMLVAYAGSGGTVEIAVRDGSARTVLGAGRSTVVRVVATGGGLGVKG
jgi:S-adenosylmethionine hydrolase